MERSGRLIPVVGDWFIKISRIIFSSATQITFWKVSNAHEFDKHNPKYLKKVLWKRLKKAREYPRIRWPGLVLGYPIDKFSCQGWRFSWPFLRLSGPIHKFSFLTWFSLSEKSNSFLFYPVQIEFLMFFNKHRMRIDPLADFAWRCQTSATNND